MSHETLSQKRRIGYARVSTVQQDLALAALIGVAHVCAAGAGRARP